MFVLGEFEEGKLDSLLVRITGEVSLYETLSDATDQQVTAKDVMGGDIRVLELVEPRS